MFINLVATLGIEPSQFSNLEIIVYKTTHAAIHHIAIKIGARDRSRTCTGFPPLGPKPSVSTIPPLWQFGYGAVKIL
jgi:hypothetical protein